MAENIVVNFKMIAQMVMVFCVGQMEKYNTAENGKMIGGMVEA
jgi:hypothetical protein